MQGTAVEKLSLLYVDDEMMLHEPFKLYMEMMFNFQVDTASSGDEALLKLVRDRFDAVVSDYQMPGMDGIQLLKNIRSSGYSIPFVIFTGRSREEVAIEAINNGADYYIMKGGDPKSLFTEMSHVISSAVMEREEKERLRIANERLEAVLNNSHDAILLFDMDYRVEYVNPSFVKIFGWTREELGRLKLPWVPESDKENAEKMIAELVSSGRSMHYDGKRCRKDGSLIDVHISISPITDPDGKVNVVSAIMAPRSKEHDH